MQTVTLDAAQVLGTVPSGTSGGIDFADYDFVFDRFDPSLGALDAVRFSSSITHTASATNDQSDLTVILLGYGISYSANGLAIWGDGAGDGNGSTTLGEFFSTSATAASTDVSFDPAYYDEFLGLGAMTFGIDRSGAGGPTYNAEITGAFTDFTVQRDAGAFVTVVYDYTPSVPEPPSAALVGLAGVLLLLRRRRQSAQ